MRLLGMDTCPSLNDIMEIRCNKSQYLDVLSGEIEKNLYRICILYKDTSNETSFIYPMWS